MTSAARFDGDADQWAAEVNRLLPDLSTAKALLVAKASYPQRLERGAALLNAGQRWQTLWWVAAGALRLFYINSQGKESNKNFFLDGQMLWPVTPDMRNRPADFFVAALEPTTVYAIDFAALETVVGDLPSWSSLQLGALTALLEEKMWRERLFLQCDARSRYADLLRARPQWGQRIPLRHLASWLGVTDVSLSRVRSDMGLISS